MVIRCFRIIAVIAATGLGQGAASAQEVRLSVSADRCSIAFALTGRTIDGCSRPQLSGRTLRSTGGADWSGYSVQFEFDSSKLKPEAVGHLDRLSKLLIGPLNELCVKLIGHTDTTGSAAYNDGLARQRAQSVRLYLAGPGSIGVNRLAAEGLGESKPLSGMPGSDPRNRRVEVLAKPLAAGACG